MLAPFPSGGRFVRKSPTTHADFVRTAVQICLSGCLHVCVAPGRSVKTKLTGSCNSNCHISPPVHHSRLILFVISPLMNDNRKRFFIYTIKTFWCGFKAIDGWRCIDTIKDKWVFFFVFVEKCSLNQQLLPNGEKMIWSEKQLELCISVWEYLFSPNSIILDTFSQAWLISFK